MSETEPTPTHAITRGRWGAPRQSFFARRSPVTAIDIDGDRLRVVQASWRLGKTVVTRFAAEHLELPGTNGHTEAKVKGEMVAKALQRLGIKPGRVVMGIPRGSVILRTIVLPNTEQVGEMASMVQFQISKDLPFRLEDAVVDFQVQNQGRSPGVAPVETTADIPAIPSAKDGQNVSVMVAAVKNEVLKYHQDLAKSAGFNLTALGLRSYANARCVELCDLQARDHCLALVSLGQDEVVIDVLLNQELVFSRVAPLIVAGPVAPEGKETGPAKAREEAAKSQPAKPSTYPEDGAAMEVVRTLHSYEGTEDHGQVTRIYVTGSNGHAERVAQALHKRLQLPCDVLDPAAALGLKNVSHEQASGAIAAFGLAFGLFDPDGLPFDFLNPKRPAQPSQGKRMRLLAIATAISVVLMLLIGVRTHFIRQKTTMKNKVLEQVNAANKNLPLYRQTQLQARTVKAWLAEDRHWLEHCALLSAILPASPELYVTSLTTGSRGAIHLSVKARNGDTITRLDARLREAGYEVRPPAITPSGDKYGYGFQANLELVASEKMKVDLTILGLPERPEDDGSLDNRPRPRAENRSEPRALAASQPAKVAPSPAANPPAATPAMTEAAKERRMRARDNQGAERRTRP